MLHIDPNEVSWTAIRAQGAGGQNVNKVSSAIHLRFDIAASALPDAVKIRLLAASDCRRTQAGVMVIKAQRHRTQEMNLMDAMQRLHEWVNRVAYPPRPRKATQPTWGSQQQRLQSKSARSQTKRLRKSGAYQNHD